MKKSKTRSRLARRTAGDNVGQLGRSLERRVQRARQQRGDDPVGAASELWKCWEDASQFSQLAERYWSAGRDASLVMLDQDRQTGLQWMQSLVATLGRLGLAQPAASCLSHTSSRLSDGELLGIASTVDLDQATLSHLPFELQGHLLQVLLSAESTLDHARLIGRLLTIQEATFALGPRAASVRSPEAQVLHRARWHGAEMVKGPVYEAQYALWRFLTSGEDIVELDLQDLEDIGLLYRLPDGTERREHVQAKASSRGWTIPDLQGKGSEANKVFDSLAEVFLVDPDADLTFATDSTLSRGQAPHLEHAVEKLRGLTAFPDHSDHLALEAIGLTASECAALRQLASGMNPEVLARISLCALLGRVNFDTGRTRRELRSAIIRRISAQLRIPDPQAEDAYKAFIGDLIESMEGRRRFSRSDLAGLIEQAALRARAFREHLIAGRRVEVLDFEHMAEASADRYYQGFSSNPADIVAGFDALRPVLLAEIDQALDQHRCCVIRAPSGQGKTTLMFRYAYSGRENAIVLRVHGGLDHEVVGEILHVVEPLQSLPVLVLVDDIARGDPLVWSAALRRLLERPCMTILATSREDDWHVSSVSSLEGVVGFVRPALDEHTAEVIFSGLQHINGVQLCADHWLEPFERSGGLLMEYVHLLTQGRRMRDLIAEQLGQLGRHLGQDAPLIIDALRWITAAHAFGGYLSRDTLSRLIACNRSSQLGRVLRVLEEEFWITQREAEEYVGLHQVRSNVTMAVLHERDVLSDTVLRLLSEMNKAELRAVLEDLLYREPVNLADLVRLLANRALSEPLPYGLNVAAAAYAASERRYADCVTASLPETRRNRSRSLLPMIATLPIPVESFQGLLNLIPQRFGHDLESDLAALPSRDELERADQLFFKLVGVDRLTQWLSDDSWPDDLVDFFHLLAIAAPKMGNEALNQSGIEVLMNQLLVLEVESLPGFLAAVRVLDPVIAIELFERIGAEEMLAVAVQVIEGCFGAAYNGETVQGRFLVGLDADTRALNEKAVRITRDLYGLFPLAEKSAVTGLLGAGQAHPGGQKTMPRKNLPLPPHHVALNQHWMFLWGERLAAPSLVQILNQHDDYCNALLQAIVMTSACLADGPQRAQDIVTVDEAWQQATGRAISASHAPVHAPQLGTLLSSLAGDALPGSAPVDRAFDQLSNAATSVQRGLENVIAKQDVNWAGLGLNLRKFHESSLRYYDVRRALPLSTDSENSWETGLSPQIERLFALVEMLAEDRKRPFRAQAKQSFSRFNELRAYAGVMVREVGEATAHGEPWSGVPERVEVLERWIEAAAVEFEDWVWFDSLIELARLLAELVADDLEGAMSQIHDVDHDVAEVLQSLWGEVTEVKSLDLELWIASRERQQRMDELASRVTDRLRSSDVEARCAVLGVERGEWLTQSATIAVVAKHTDLRNAVSIRDTVKSTVFASTPESVARIYLLINHQGDDVLPSAYYVWRISDHIENPYHALNPYAPWYPETVDKALAEQLGLTVDQRQDPVVERVSSIFGVRNTLHLALLQFGALHVTANDPHWVMSHGAWKCVIERLQQHVAELHAAVESLAQTLSDKDATWQLVGYGAIEALNRYLAWLLAAARSKVEPQRVAEILTEALEELDQAMIGAENKLYFGRASNTNVLLDGPSDLYAYYLELHEAIDELLREVSAELS